MPELLLELLSEEIPARMQKRAGEDLKRLVTEGLKAAGLEFASAEAAVRRSKSPCLHLWTRRQAITGSLPSSLPASPCGSPCRDHSAMAVAPDRDRLTSIPIH